MAATTVGTYPIGSSIDTRSAALGDAGQTGEHLWAQCVCSTTPVGSGASVQALLQSAPDNATWTTAVAGPVLPITGVSAGTPLLQVQPPPGMQEYWRMAVVVTGATLTAGTFDAFLSESLQRNVPQPTGFAVS